MNRIETKGGKASLDSWLNLSAMENKLQLDRVRLLQCVKPWKIKRVELHGKDETCKKLTVRLRNKENQF